MNIRHWAGRSTRFQSSNSKKSGGRGVSLSRLLSGHFHRSHGFSAGARWRSVWCKSRRHIYGAEWNCQTGHGYHGYTVLFDTAVHSPFKMTMVRAKLMINMINQQVQLSDCPIFWDKSTSRSSSGVSTISWSSRDCRSNITFRHPPNNMVEQLTMINHH